MKQIKIEKNVELPVRYKKICKKYPFEQMEVNDSFLVPYDGDHKRVVQSRVSAQMSKYKKETKTDFTLRSLEEGIRVWRLK